MKSISYQNIKKTLPIKIELLALAALTGACAPWIPAHAAEYFDLNFTNDAPVVTFSTVTRVHREVGRITSASSTVSVGVTIKGTNSSGESVKLSLQRVATTDSNFDILMDDCARKASLAMASPSTLGFRYTLTSPISGSVTINTENRDYTVTRSASATAHEVRCSLIPAGDSSSD
jgi:hypothetical protein